MSLPKSPQAYNDCFEMLDRAAADTRGIRAKVKNRSAATFLKMRLHNARQIDRDRNKKVYEEGHPMHGCSSYDHLIVQIRGNDAGIWVYITPINNKVESVETLSDIDEEETEQREPEIEEILQETIEQPPREPMVRKI